MGNKASCIACSSTDSQTAKLIVNFGNGNGSYLHLIQLPASVAELMIEFPGHAISRADDLPLTRRVEAMRADEQLRPGEVYLMVSRGRVRSRIDDRQVAVVRGVLRRGKIRMSDSGDLGGHEVAPKSNEEEAVDVGFLGGPRRAGARQWRPLLDTIIERP